jgi:alpha-L-rhamnosidase
LEVGLLHANDWTARFVTPDWDDDTSKPQPSPLLRRALDVRAGVKEARLYVTALGVYEAEINGVIVGDHVLAPGWTSYGHRLRYQTFDVTAMLREGRNAVGAILGDGWFRGRIGFNGGRRNIYGDRLALLAQLEIRYANGTTEPAISTARDLRRARGAIGLVAGSLRRRRLGRRAAHRSRPHHARCAERPSRAADRAGRPERHHYLAVGPHDCRFWPEPGRQAAHRLAWNGRTDNYLRHAEVLEHGELGTRPLRQTAATDRYTLRGDGLETWEPRFTFHGFRYAEVDGWPGGLRLDDLTAVVCHSNMERTGWFECSDPLISRLHENIVWSMRGNFLDVPTDCPQRDERLGWTGDIQVFAPTASFLYDCAGFLQSWLADLAAEQADADGVASFVSVTHNA